MIVQYSLPWDQNKRTSVRLGIPTSNMMLLAFVLMFMVQFASGGFPWQNMSLPASRRAKLLVAVSDAHMQTLTGECIRLIDKHGSFSLSREANCFGRLWITLRWCLNLLPTLGKQHLHCRGSKLLAMTGGQMWVQLCRSERHGVPVELCGAKSDFG